MRTDFLTCSAFVLIPLAALGTAACTFGGLDALGAGSRDSGADTSVVANGADADVDTSTGDEPDAGDMDDATLAEASDEADADAGDATEAEAEADVSTGPPNALGVYIDAGTATFCDLHQALYQFCDDFDHRPLPSRFSASDGQFLYSTSSLPSSAPDDLLLYVPANNSGGTWGSKLSQTFSTAAHTVTMEFDFNPSSTNSTTSGVLFAAVDFTGSPTSKYSVRLAYNSGAPRLEESTIGTGINDLYHSNLTIPTDTWSRIQVTLTFIAPDGGADGGPLTGTETISINGTQVQEETLTPNPNFSQVPTLLIGGVFGTYPTTGWVFRYDNVTFNLN
jgi:hypothetical protein